MLELLAIWTILFGGGGGGILDIDPGLMIWTTVTFLLLLAFLGKFAWKPIVRTLQDREGKIRESLEQAEKARREAKALMSKNEELIGRAQQEADEIVRQAKDSAEQLRGSLADKAKSEADEMIATAKREIETEKNAALTELRKEVVELALQAASKVVGENLDKETHRKVVSDFIDSIPGSN